MKNMNMWILLMVGLMVILPFISQCSNGSNKESVSPGDEDKPSSQVDSKPVEKPVQEPVVKPEPVKPVEPEPKAVFPEATAANLRNLSIEELYTKFVDVSAKEIIDFDTMIQRLKGIQAIYTGESHTSTEQHKLQLDVISALYKNNKKVAVGFEFLQRPMQPEADKFSAGKITEEELFKTISKTFGNWYRHYQPIWKFIGKNGIKAVAMNVDNALKEKYYQKGWDGLSDDEKKLVAKDIDTSNVEHREYVLAQFGGMIKSGIMTPDKIERLYWGQCVWDETFGESIANYLKEVNDLEAQIVIILGRAHAEYKFNTPNRALKRYDKLTFKTIIPIELNKQGQVDFEKLLSSGIGDFLAFTPISTNPDQPKMPRMPIK
ncbi:MAG: ChaN family lipoprotein [Planctomycetes bacterium]|nr:ChaN family lipoprotein [Planctomycetota bacterium]